MTLRLLFTALFLAASVAAHAEEARLTILHTTDLHGSLTSWDYLADRPAPRGLVKLATLVRQVRAEGAPLVLVDNGDVLQGSPMQAMWHAHPDSTREPMMAAMTALGYDAMAVGNHEFDRGLAALERARQDAGFPFLAVNVARASDGALAFAPSVIKTVGSLRVGIVGVCTPATPQWLDPTFTAGLRFLSPFETVAGEVGRLRTKERCDVIVVLAHTGFEKDPATRADVPGADPMEHWGYRLMSDIGGVDAWVFGHSHDSRPSIPGRETIGAQAGSRGESLGRIDLELTRPASGGAWTVTRRSARLLAVSDTTADDPELAALVAPYHEKTRAALDEVVGQASGALDAPGGRAEDGPAWDLVHEAQRRASGAPVSMSALLDPAPRLGPGPIRMRDVYRLYPYDNTLAVVRLTGAELKASLEHAARYFQTYTYEHGRPLTDPAIAGYQFDAAEGVSYELDLTRPPGERVVNLSRDGRPIDDADTMRVVVNSYRAGGGGGYRAIGKAPRVWSSPVLVRDAILELLRSHSSVEAARVPNWTIVPDYASTTERPLLDRLVREGVAPAEELLRIHPREPAQRADAAYWLARAFGWREKRPSGAFADVPDELEPWLDGLVKRSILGTAQTGEEFEPFRLLPLTMALDWCERAARHAGYALLPPPAPSDPSFRRSLVTGIGLVEGSPGLFVQRDTLTRVQAIGIVSNLRFPTLRVLETTDFHGAILPGARDRRTGRPVGGSAVLAAHIARLRGENPEGTVLIDGGDWYQGTMISNLSFGRPVIEQMNALGYVAAAVGNHEFDWTADTLIRRIHEFKGAALGANVREIKSGRRPRWAKSDTIVTRRGVRVGVLGVCYPETPTVTLAKYVAHLRFEDDSATAAPLAERLRKKDKVDAVIGLGHVPGRQDSGGGVSGDLGRLVRGVKGVDAWFGGHSHNVVEGEVNGVPGMIAGAHAEWIAVCDLVVDPLRDRVIERHTRIDRTWGDSVTPDTAMAARVARWNRDIAPIAAAPVGRNAAALTRNRSGESTVGNLVADAMREAVTADVALQNAGGLRADLPAGDINRGHIYEVMPFDNTVVTLTLTGAQLKQALEDALAGERVTQVSGIRYTFDPRRPARARVVAVTLPDGTPIDEARRYKVAVNNFMADGGDSYSALAKATDKVDTQVTIRDRLEAFVRAKCANGAALDYRPDGRVRRVDASSAD